MWVGLLFDGGAWSVVVPVFYFFGVPEGGGFSPCGYWGGGAVVGVVVGPGAWAYSDMGGAFLGVEEAASGVFVDDDGVHLVLLVLVGCDGEVVSR